jgi:ketosteroid isomerase-like protein
METPEVAVVRSWHSALNAGDTDGLVALSSDDVEVGGPRGSSQGAAVLREWFARAGICLEPKKFYQRGETVVVEETAEWREPGTDDLIGQQTVATLFVVRGGLVTRVVRYPDLATALGTVGNR